ncbi:histidine phosphatase family protein [Leptothrix discophora]|uniref:Histidine phosphatase family protein n=1 Tax=Leptothrix discophora TaxID=89 RepID=A0ABT9G2I2_LEPDI|nr:histidine phosphatase family protein [Leptothrix discophora]MDP4300668.1 histidine phosphatase family protein [Leptothrix discophora]
MSKSPSPDRRLALRRGAGTVAGLALVAATGWPRPGRASADAAALLRSGGVVLAIRHAIAPGTFDPPEFRLGDCRTQRNLDEAGREQSRRIGGWFTERALAPQAVRSSPWCRCVDTATLAFGRAEVWPALGSPYGRAETSNAAALAELDRQLATVADRPGGFEVWVTHQFVLSAWVGTSTASGEGLLLRSAAGRAEVLARFQVT